MMKSFKIWIIIFMLILIGFALTYSCIIVSRSTDVQIEHKSDIEMDNSLLKDKKSKIDSIKKTK